MKFPEDDISTNKKLRIIAYGFDVLGFELPTTPVSVGDNAQIEYLSFPANAALDEADGAIIPQGIFERIEYSHGYGETYTDVHVKKAILQERQKQVFNLIDERKWVCFLVGSIIDKVPNGWDTREIDDTDLCKRLLNALGITKLERHTVDGLTIFATKRDEFRAYLRDYGVVNTVFELPYNRARQFQIVADSAGAAVAIEWANQVFFLPFHTTKREVVTLNLIATEVARAILDYRQKRIAEVPTWVDEFKFTTEEKLGSEIEALQKQIADWEGQLQIWKDYKGILSTSGDILKARVVAILRGFFGLKVDAPEEFREDAKLLDEHTCAAIAFAEIKGTKAGIKREHINQVDSHRERAGLSPSVSGVLIINNEMSVTGVKERFETTVPGEQIDHAKRQNVLIIRTIDLLYLILQFEDRVDRKEKFLGIIGSGGGWLRVTPTEFQVICSVKQTKV